MSGENKALTTFGASPALTLGAKRASALYGIIGATVFAALTYVGANIFIPLTPVPLTLQTLFVLLAGAVVGGRYGTLGQFMYVGLGSLGLPIFATHAGGLGILGGPTGGYLLSFLVVPFLISALINRKPSSVVWQACVFSAGTVVIFAMGVAHLTLFYTHNFIASLQVGVFPFIPGAIFKVAAAVSIYRSYAALANRRRERSIRG